MDRFAVRGKSHALACNTRVAAAFRFQRLVLARNRLSRRPFCAFPTSAGLGFSTLTRNALWPNASRFCRPLKLQTTSYLVRRLRVSRESLALTKRGGLSATRGIVTTLGSTVHFTARLRQSHANSFKSPSLLSSTFAVYSNLSKFTLLFSRKVPSIPFIHCSLHRLSCPSIHRLARLSIRLFIDYLLTHHCRPLQFTLRISRKKYKSFGKADC